LYQAPRGTRDILPDEQAYWCFVEEKAAAVCRLYGYQRIDTPIFEDTNLFVRSVGKETDIVSKEMYTFTDRGGNQLTLRPEGTAPVCRAYIEHGLSQQTKPVKHYYLTHIFRYDRPQAGRYRQHHQFGCEAIGDSDPAIDAEVIDTAWRFFNSLGLKKLTLRINSIGCKSCRPGYLKLLKEYYTSHREKLCPDCQKRFTGNTLRLLDCKRANCQKLAREAPRSSDHLCPACDDHFVKLKAYLDNLDLPFGVDHRLVRGLDYYTRTVFEVQPESEGSQSTLGGGGRYDDLIAELGGKPTPALGFACGLERIILNLKKQKVPIEPPVKPAVFIAFLGEEAKEEAIKLASRLRKEDIGVIQATGPKSLKAQLRQANNLGAGYAVIIGELEVKEGNFILRDMESASQKTLSLKELTSELKSLTPNS